MISYVCICLLQQTTHTYFNERIQSGLAAQMWGVTENELVSRTLGTEDVNDLVAFE